MAWRYWAMRGESLEPGGCSDTPTSGSAALTIACPTELAGRVATAVVAVVPSVAPVLALRSWSAKLEVPLVAVEMEAGAEVAAGVSICCSSATRARTRSKDISNCFGGDPLGL